MGFINKVKKEEVSKLLEARETLLNLSGVFHVIVGARTLREDNARVRDVQVAARMMMEVKNDHEKILAKLIELGANIHAKDVA